MCVELYPHNQIAYDNAKRIFESSNKAAVIHPTGSGKSYIIIKYALDNQDKIKIILAPSNVIFDQLKEHNNDRDLPNTYNISYQKLIEMSEDEIAKLNAEIIVLDEFHHCGAEVWGKSVQTLINLFPDAKLLGTSATHIRYLDGERNMVDEIFEGNIASHITLPQAIGRGILDKPFYINSLYTFDLELDKVYDVINKSYNNKDEKEELTKKVELAKHQLENTMGVPHILKKYIKDFNNKFIVFCKNEQHLKEMQNKVVNWFSEAKLSNGIRTYTVLSKYQNSDDEFIAFKNDAGNGLRLLFCVDMLNEGLHLNDISGVILLRPTTSPIIYHQQIGRAMSVGNKNTPMIFDFVNNFVNIRVKDFIKEVNEAIDKRQDLNEEEKYNEKEIVKSRIFDETPDAKEIFECIYERLTDYWNYRFKQLKEHLNSGGSYFSFPKGSEVGRWLKTQISNYNKGWLSCEKINKLESIGVEWDRFRAQWMSNYYKCKEYFINNGHCNITVIVSFELGINQWIQIQRRLHKEGKLAKWKIDLLNEIGFIFEYDIWEENYNKAEYFHNIHGRLPTKSKEDKEILKWLGHQRDAYKLGKLTQDKIDKLKYLGFNFDKIWRYDISGKKYEHFDVIKQIDSKKNSSGFVVRMWEVQCNKCARIRELSTVEVKQGKLCECMTNRTGMIFGDFTISKNTYEKENRNYLYECVCKHGIKCKHSLFQLKKLRIKLDCGCTNKNEIPDRSRKPVDVFKDNIFIANYSSGFEMENKSLHELGVKLFSGYIPKVIRGEIESYKGFTFAYSK